MRAAVEANICSRENTHTHTQTMDFPEHLKLLQQLGSLWGEGSEQEEGRRERQKGGSGEKTAIHAFKASMPEINTTSCNVVGGHVHISQCVCECFTGGGGWWR